MGPPPQEHRYRGGVPGHRLVDGSGDSDVTDQPPARVKVRPDDADNMNMQRAAIMESVHNYDAYGVHGSLERISKVASRVWEARAAGTLADCELDDLRAALFMTQRGWHSDGNCVAPDVGVEWELVEAINETSGGLVRDDRPILL